jgi:type II secretory pathway pseudopilin PulG
MQSAQETTAHPGMRHPHAPIEDARGFAMAALLVAMALMSLGLSVAMPTWRTLVQREKEEELIWRGQQYDRAVQLYRKKNAAPGAPSIDKLVEGRFLRKKYRDPITNGEFETVGVSATGNAPGVQQPQRGFGQLIAGVRSKSKQRSIKILNGRSTYNEWQFTYVPWKPGGQPTTPGGPGNQNNPATGARPGARPGTGSSPFGSGRGSGGSTFGQGAGTASPTKPNP